MVGVSMEPIKWKKFLMFWPCWRIEADTNHAVNKIGLELISASCMFDIVPTIQISCRDESHVERWSGRQVDLLGG